MQEEIIDSFNEAPPEYVEYVSLMRRVSATLIDGVILGVGIGVLSFTISAAGLEGLPLNVLMLLPSILTLVYKLVLEKEFGKTLGKMMVGIAVADESLYKISWQQCLIRNYYYIISTLMGACQDFLIYQNTKQPGSDFFNAVLTQADDHAYMNYISYALLIAYGIDCLMMSKDGKNQTLHDKWAKTVVVRESFLRK